MIFYPVCVVVPGFQGVSKEGNISTVEVVQMRQLWR